MKDILAAGKKPMNVFAAEGAFANSIEVVDCKAPEQADQQPADRPIEQRAEDNGQRIHADADPPKVQRADQTEHDINGDEHGDGDHLARREGRCAAGQHNRHDQRGGCGDQNSPYGGGQLCDLRKHCEDLLFSF